MRLETDLITFKVVAVGHAGVGKTSLVTQYIKGVFKDDYNVTIGVEFYTKPMVVDGSKIQLQIWDTVMI
jgi:small GTP-binding protein